MQLSNLYYYKEVGDMIVIPLQNEHGSEVLLILTIRSPISRLLFKSVTCVKNRPELSAGLQVMPRRSLTELKSANAFRREKNSEGRTHTFRF